MSKRRLLHALGFVIVGAPWVACATGEDLGAGTGYDASVGGGGNEDSAMPMPTTTSMPTAMPTTTSMPTTTAPPMDGAPPADAEADAAPVGPPCPSEDLKRCAGVCINPSPTFGCSLDDCEPCPMSPNGVTTCDGDSCVLTCNDGYMLAGDACYAPVECTDGQLNNTETDVDCGGVLCPPCPPGDDCQDDDDCALGPCENMVCGCTGLTCDDVNGCGATVDNGCGGTIDCSGNCAGSDVCFNGTCCAPITTCSADICGPSDNGCGGTVDCGDCDGNDVCVNGACCTPACGANACGAGASDGCGGTLDCGTCGSGVCYNNACCTPITPATCGNRCGGTVSDGCGGMVDCSGNTCSGNQCISGTCCVPSSCTQSCGFQSNGCGGNACPLCGGGEGCDNDNDCQSNDCSFEWIGCGLLSNCCQ